MKLRNKKTGEIKEYGSVGATTFADGGVLEAFAVYDSLAALNEEWEDYEEPKEYCYITGRGNFHFIEDIDDEGDKERKAIGNYFETEEEAEKAVEKLKAWKRLKDKGFRFERWLLGGEYGNTITFSDYIEVNDETRADLDLLFGGEE